MTTVEPTVVIVGGAVAGATLAHALGRQGVRTILIEKLARERHGARGDVMHPPALRMLDSVGLLDPLHADGALHMRTIAISDAPRGILARYEQVPQGEGLASRTTSVPHDRIEAVLYECASRSPSVSLQRGIVTGLTRDADGRVNGVRFRPGDSGVEQTLAASVVVGCDGTQSLTRRELGIEAEGHDYKRDLLFVECEGSIEPAAALHYHVDDQGLLCVVARPRGESRLFFTVERGAAITRGADPILRDHVVARFPTLATLTILRERAYLYKVSNRLARSFWAPGAALAGDAAHTTHPVGATGMSLAIVGAVRLAQLIGGPLTAGAKPAEIDAALVAYEGERRAAASAAIMATHAKALQMYEGELHRDPDAFARIVDPRAAWTTEGAGYGQDPAGQLAYAKRTAT